MITSMELRNFQAHKDTVFEFSDGVNAIVGESDVGKSAVIRALYWVVFGRPTGDSMIRRGVRNPCEVTIKTSDGHTIRRVRGKTDNFYEVDGEVYKAFGKGVPDVVLSTLNLSEINFSRQLDPPFALSMPGGELAQYLNKLIDLEIIGSSLSDINKMANEANSRVELDKAGIAQAKQSIRSFKWVSSAEKRVSELERLESTVVKRRRAVSRIRNELEQCARAQARIDIVRFVKNAEEDFKGILQLANNLKSKKTHAQNIDGCLKVLQKLKKGLQPARWVDGADVQVSELIRRVRILDALKEKARALRAAEEIVTKTSKKLQEALCKHKEAVVYYRENKPNTCPLCGQKLEDV